MNTYEYRLYGCVLRSEIPFEQLVKAEVGEQLSEDEEKKLIVLSVGGLEDKVLEEYHRGKMLRISREFIWFSNQYGIFQIKGGREINIQPLEQVPIKHLTSFVFGYCIAMLFWQRGLQAIHCSAVSYNDRALLIAGGSGSGKSTLTHCFLKHGARLMCDDVAIVEGKDGKTYVYPAFPMQKLCKDAALRSELDTESLFCVDEDRDKYALPYEGEFSTEAVELGAVICLNKANQAACSIEKYAGHDSLKAVINNLFLKPMFEYSYPFPPEDMVKCLSIAGSVPVFKLRRPMVGDTVEEQRKLILGELDSNLKD